MVQHLFNLIGLAGDSAAPCETTLEPSQIIRVANSMLTEIHAADIYNVAKDNESGGHQLKFYKQLADKCLVMPMWVLVVIGGGMWRSG